MFDEPIINSVFSNMSSCYLRLKNYSKAMEYAEICIKLKPKWPKGYYRKGMVFFEQENYVDSATSFYMGCELDPKDKKLSNMVWLVLDLLFFSSEIVLKEEKDNMLKKKQERRVFSLCKIESFLSLLFVLEIR